MEIQESLERCVDKLRALRVEKFELAFERSSSVGIEVKEGKLDHLSRSTDQGLSIRTLKDGKLGFSYTFDLSREAVETAAKQALEVGELMPADPMNDLGNVAGGKTFRDVAYPHIEAFDSAGLEVALEKKIELAKELEAAARARDARIKRVRKSGFSAAEGESILVDTAGTPIRFSSTLFTLGLLCVAEQGTEAETGSDGRYAVRFGELDAHAVAATAVENALEGLGGGACPTMTCPAVFKNSVVADLVGFLAASFSAENIDRNTSLLVGKKGQKLFSDKLTLIDDALLAGGVSTSPFDGEGAPCQKTTLVARGLVENFLYDSYYARKHKARSTASSRRGSLKAQPSIGPSNLYLEKGARGVAELVREAGRGIYITDLLGLHTANPVTGEFSVGASGILIENGALTRPVKGFAIAGNLVSLLADVTEVGSDLRFWGGIGAPSMLVSKLNVSGA